MFCYFITDYQMTKDTKKPNDLLPHFIFIGRCWTKKYEKMAKKVTAYLESTYNNRVTILCRVKRPTPLIQVLLGY